MLKRLALALACIAFLANSPADKKSGSDFPKNDRETNPSPGVSFIQNEASQPNTRPSYAEPPPWWKEPEWWICILSIPTMFFIGWQARATARSAKATEEAVTATKRSIEMQEAEFVQWVDMGKWSVEKDQKAHWSTSGNTVTTPHQKMKARIKFSLLNNSIRPLTIRSVRIFLTIGTEKSLSSFIVEERDEVAPRGKYGVAMDIVFNSSHADDFILGRLLILARVQVDFANALGMPAEVEFSRLVMASVQDGTRSVSRDHVAKSTYSDEHLQNDT